MRDENLAVADEVVAAVRALLDSGRCAYASSCGELEGFESAFAGYVGAPYAVGVSSGTSALTIALRALGVGPGDEVVTVANTFVATAEAILLAGARPVFTDVDARTGLMDPAAAADAIGPRTRALVPVHLHGAVAPMPALVRLARDRALAVVEDCAHAVGATLAGRHAGTFGDVGCFSFYPAKGLGTLGKGGAIVTADEALARRAKALRNHGEPQAGAPVTIGLNGRMSPLDAVVARVKLPHVAGWNAARRAQARAYDAALAGLAPRLEIPPGCVSAHHVYAVLVPRRDAVRAALEAAGIETRVHYPVPISEMAAYRDAARAHGSLASTRAHCAALLSLPLHGIPLPGAVDAVVAALREALG